MDDLRGSELREFVRRIAAALAYHGKATQADVADATTIDRKTVTRLKGRALVKSYQAEAIAQAVAETAEVPSSWFDHLDRPLTALVSRGAAPGEGVTAEAAVEADAGVSPREQDDEAQPRPG